LLHVVRVLRRAAWSKAIYAACAHLAELWGKRLRYHEPAQRMISFTDRRMARILIKKLLPNVRGSKDLFDGSRETVGESVWTKPVKLSQKILTIGFGHHCECIGVA
jgi:hypothetical protein